jgi:hypothetical protein
MRLVEIITLAGANPPTGSPFPPLPNSKERMMEYYEHKPVEYPNLPIGLRILSWAIGAAIGTALYLVAYHLAQVLAA